MRGTTSMNMLRAGIALSIAILLGRLSGLVREMVLAHQFGAGTNADIAILLLTLPDLLISLLLSGGLSAALTPAFRRLPKDESVQLLVQSSFWGLLFLSALSLAMATVPAFWLGMLAPGLEKEIIAGTAGAARIILLALPLSGVTGIFSAYLNAHNKFFFPACGTLVFNTVLILGLFNLDAMRATQVSSLAFVVVFAAGMRWLLLVIMLPKFHIKKLPSRHLIDKPLLTRFSQALLGSCILILYPVIARGIASFEGSGQISLFNYSSKLIELPLGMAISVISAMSLPKLTSLFNQPKQLNSAIDTWRQSLSFTIVLSVSIFITCICRLDEIGWLIFGHGRLDHLQIHALGKIATFGFISIVFQGINATLSSGCYARLDTRTPLRCNLLGLLLLVPFCYGLASLFGTPGIALGMALSHAISCCILWVHCQEFARKNGQTLINTRMLCAVCILLLIGGVGGYAQTYITSHFFGGLSIIAQGSLLLWIGIAILSNRWHIGRFINTGKFE